METKNAPAKKSSLTWDKLNSTYWWEITLDHKHPRNYNYKVKEITGYSKAQGHDEARDKAGLLRSKIYMLAQNGYIERCQYILFFKRAGSYVSKEQDTLLLTLLPKDFKLQPDQLGKYPSTVRFLTELYENIRTGKSIEHLLPKKQNAEWSKDDIFKPEKYNFPSRAHLYTFAEQKIKDGHAYEQVQNFVVKYQETRFPL